MTVHWSFIIARRVFITISPVSARPHLWFVVFPPDVLHDSSAHWVLRRPGRLHGRLLLGEEPGLPVIEPLHLLGLRLGLLLDWRRLLLRLWGQGFDDVQHFEQVLLLEG